MSFFLLLIPYRSCLTSVLSEGQVANSQTSFRRTLSAFISNHIIGDYRKNTGDQDQVPSLGLYTPFSSHLLVKGRDSISRGLEPRPSSQILITLGAWSWSPSAVAKDLSNGEKQKYNQCSHRDRSQWPPSPSLGYKQALDLNRAIKVSVWGRGIQN
jgi:hypothetical protein